MSNSNEQSYDRIAEDFVNQREKANPDDLVIKFASLLRKGDRILDIGCGGGIPVTKFLSDQGLDITGIDISAKLLEQAQLNVPGGRFIKADIAEFDPTEQFAGIVAWDSLFHLQPDQQKSVFTKISKLLTRDGLLLFTHGGSEGQIESEMFGQTFTYSGMGSEKMKNSLNSLGFNIVDWVIDESEGSDHLYLKALVQKYE